MNSTVDDQNKKREDCYDMNVQNKLYDLLENQIIPTLSDSILNYCEEAVADEALSFEETDYATAKEELSLRLTKQEYALLTETEGLYLSMQKYAAKHGFISGIIFGFARYFSSSNCEDYDFEKSVVDGLLSVPGIDRHPEYKEWCEKHLHNLAVFEKTLPAELYEHIISVESAWDQRIYSAAFYAFQWGRELL